MYLGVFSVLLQALPLAAALDKVSALGLDCIEIGTGAYPATTIAIWTDCCPRRSRLQSTAGRLNRPAYSSAPCRVKATRCIPMLALPMSITPLSKRRSCSPSAWKYPLSICCRAAPATLFNARYPNWCHFAWPPDYPELWAWQWNEVAIPYWKRATAFAEAHGIRQLAVEMHPGFLVYNPVTALKLREAVGNTIGVNLDPSHLFWLGIDVPAAIRKLASAIFHVHAKDCAINHVNLAIDGCLDGRPYLQVAQRSWNFRTVGWGHGLEVWRDIASALREVGYDYVLSIEHEDPLAEPMRVCGARSGS